MRYYKIQIGNPTGGVTNSLSAQGGIYTSHPNGPQAPPDPGALDMEMILTSTGLHNVVSGSSIRIWGISLQDIAQSRNLMPTLSTGTGMPIYVYGGMGVGLPLANPSESGLLVSGTIFQAFGNWIGTKQSLDIIMIPGTNLTPPLPHQQQPDRNISWNWPAGVPMATAIAQSLAVAYPTYKQNISISPNLKRPNQEAGFYANLTMFSQYLHDLSLSIMNNSGYAGVTMSLKGDTVTVSDGTQQASAAATKALAFTDLIGQPTWINQAEIQVTCVMRADIDVQDVITLPAGPTITSADSYASFRTGAIFQGTWYVKQVQHVGNFRQPNAEAWITVLDCVQLTIPAGQVTVENITIQ
jgi:hypothetical protein